jgi:hypothetical protein
MRAPGIFIAPPGVSNFLSRPMAHFLQVIEEPGILFESERDEEITERPNSSFVKLNKTGIEEFLSLLFFP